MPKLNFNKPSFDNHKNTSESVSNQTEFAALQIQNYSNSKSEDTANKKTKFCIPNLFPKEHSTASVKDKENENTMIDLKMALVSENERKLLPKKAFPKPIEEFSPQFIDCEILMDVSIHPKSVDFDERCDRHTLNDLKKEFKSMQTNTLSILGKIIHKKYRKKNLKIPHSFKHGLIAIERFKFDIPSPDDKILAHLEKK